MAESYQDVSARKQPTRVQIKYEVEIGGAKEKKQLPFVMGVIGDFSGDTLKDPLSRREFTELNPDTFDNVMAAIHPTLRSLQVENKLEEGGADLSFNLEFNSIDAFNPEEVARHVTPLRELLELRDKLVELRSRTEVSQDAGELLMQIIHNAELRERYKAERSQPNVGGGAQ
jgi:type VI secretion system protein ImpB